MRLLAAVLLATAGVAAFLAILRYGLHNFEDPLRPAHRRLLDAEFVA